VLAVEVLGGLEVLPVHLYCPAVNRLEGPCSARKETDSYDSPIPKPLMSDKTLALSKRSESVNFRSSLNLAPGIKALGKAEPVRIGGCAGCGADMTSQCNKNEPGDLQAFCAASPATSHVRSAHTAAAIGAAFAI